MGSPNLWAVLVSGVLYWVIGAAWYSPVLFAKPWTQALGRSERELKKTNMPATFLVTLVAEVLAAYVLAHFVAYVGANTVSTGLTTGFWAWLGFVATTMLVNHLYSGKSRVLLLIDGGYHLVGLLVMGAVLAAWR